MASFLREVVTSINENEKDNITSSLPKLLAEVEKFKVEVKFYLENQYVNFEPLVSENIVLQEKCEQISRNINNLSDGIESLTAPAVNEAYKEIEDIKGKLTECLYSLVVCDHLLGIDNKLEEFNNYLNDSEYENARKSLLQLKTNLETAKRDLQYLDIFTSLDEQYLLAEFNLLSQVRYIWDENVALSSDEGDSVSYLIELQLSCLDNFREAVNVLFLVNETTLRGEIRNFFEFIHDNILKNIIDYSCDVNVVKDDCTVLSVTIQKTKPKYIDVFKNILTVLEFLNRYFSTENDMFVTFLGKKISEEFTEKLIKSCLADTVPNTPEEMASFDTIKNDINRFQQQLIQLHFLTDTNKSILEYANNVDVLFANKLSEKFLHRAKTIMSTQMHNLTTIDTVKHSETVTFEQCQISNNILDLIDLILEILDLATESSDMCAGKLVVAASNILFTYPDFVLQHHKRLIETIPQHVALFYNNCMYLIYFIQTIDEKYSAKLPNMNLTLNLCQLTDKLQSKASHVFLEQVQNQRKIIVDILNDSDLRSLGQKNKFDDSTDKIMRQCLRQLELLHTVWRKVLASEIYNKTMGNLLNSFVENLIKRVLCVEDISSECSKQLVSYFTLIKQRGPKVFIDPNEIHQYVPLWMKFNEIIFLLEASLNDIEERWADKKGPLGLHFTPEELKSVVRALFQNTDRRAAFLNKIK